MTKRQSLALNWLTFVAIATAAMMAALRLSGDSAIHPYNSDTAIQLLMANADSWTPFHLYYFGQDRFGALPFTLASLIHVVTGLRWTPFTLGATQTLFCFVGAFAFGKLTRAPALYAAVGAICMLVFSVRYVHFDLAPYGWQLALIFFAWWALRAARIEWSWKRAAIATFAVFIASWLSALSAPLLLIVAFMEAAFAPGRWRRFVLVGPAICGGLLEGAVRGLHQVYSKRTFGHSYRTNMGLKLEGAASSLWDLVRTDDGPGLFVCGTLLASVVAIVLLVRARRRSLVNDHLVIVATLGAMVFAQLFLVAASVHVRDNLDSRYLNIADTMAKLAVAVFAIEGIRRFTLHAELPMTIVANAFLLAAPLWMKDPGRDAEQTRFRNVALALTEGRTAPTYLLSVYWEVYAVAGMHPVGAILPVTLRDNYHRTPFTDRGAAEQEFVWVGRNSQDGVALAEPPPEYLYEAGTLFHKRSDAPLQVEGRMFVAYRSLASRVESKQRIKTCEVEVTAVSPAAQSSLFLTVGKEARVSVSFVTAAGLRSALRVFKNEPDVREYLAPGPGTFSFAIAKSHEGRCDAADALVLRPQSSSSSASDSAPTGGTSP